MPPKLSVVIASVNGLPSILECLESLEALPERDQMEILVLDRCGRETAQTIAQRFPRVSLHAGRSERSIPELRWQGMRAARGEMVAVLEDHCIVTTQWAAEILRFAHSPYGVIGGPVENASNRILDWAFYLAEYTAAIPPLPEGETDAVPGNNAAYRRSVLPLADSAWASLWENFLQQELRRRGVRFFLNPAMLIHHKKRFRLGEMLAQRFYYSRSLAAMRGTRMGAAGRLLRAAASLVLPLVLLWRVVFNLARKRRNVKEFLVGLPAIALFVVAWAAGDVAGYLAGGGNSLQRVE